MEVPMLKTPEGILDWKKTEWILHPGNPGVTPNVAHCVRLLADGTGLFELRCHYEGDRLIRTEMLELDRDFEQLTDRQRIEEMLLGR
ncbi:Putative ADP-ribose pyrophosphatase [Thermobacillus xylanilyticus]|uniref:ADP-ribose pyrophosphatase n=2 Tax=Thermobacillus xylanilyticus TaxID=76633 RepID=A0ABN7RPF8_THEXY|nr:Putative ADP-ribose pyrophosphatase [Thermobacillus xylanilyticus]